MIDPNDFVLEAKAKYRLTWPQISLLLHLKETTAWRKYKASSFKRHDAELLLLKLNDHRLLHLLRIAYPESDPRNILELRNRNIDEN